MDAKQTAFIAMMSSLGIVLSIVSLNLSPPLMWIPGPGGGAAVVPDLSHVATFVAAVFGGPFIGAIVGFLGGIYAGYYFGYVAGGLGLLSLIGVPLGKAMTGLLAGFLYKKLKVGTTSEHPIMAVPLTLLSYVPESVYTITYFLYVVTIFGGGAMAFMIPFVIPKGWIEVSIMSLVMGTLAGNTGFREFMTRLFPSKTNKPSAMKIRS
jgi:LytS/YehU family sensor histidine kinase